MVNICGSFKLVALNEYTCASNFQAEFSVPNILMKFSYRLVSFFRLDALALIVIAAATWLAGWLSVTAGIVLKRLNVSENFFDHLIAPS